jgi:hypothetical protein
MALGEFPRRKDRSGPLSYLRRGCFAVRPGGRALMFYKIKLKEVPMIARFIRRLPHAVEKWFYKLEVWLDSIARKAKKK